MVSIKTAVVGVLAGLALAGCSSSSSNTSDAGSAPTITSFTVTPSSLPTAGGSVTLAWTVSGATSLSIDKGVGTVTPVTTGSTTATVTATTTFTLTATDASGTSTSTALATVAPAITVSGTVNDQFGAVAAGETVLITSGTFSQSTVSDANGAFSVMQVPTPYDATVLDSGGKLAFQFRGLTRPDPTLFELTSASLTRTSSVAGGFTGGNFPEPTNYSTNVRFVSPETSFESSQLNVLTGDSVYSGSVNWLGPATTTGTLYALETHAVGGIPSDYPGYGTLQNVVLHDTGSLTGQTIPMSPVTTGTLSGTITAATGYSLGLKEALLVVAKDATIQVVGDSSAGTTFNYTAPSISGTSLTLLVLGSDGAGNDVISTTTGLTANSTGVSINIPAAPTLTLPVAAATGVSVTTPFSWTNFTGVYLVIFSTTSGPTYYVFTTETTATIPDLASAGLPLPASAAGSWRVLGFGPNTSLDAVAVPGGLINLELTEGYIGESAARDFTTAM